MWWYTSRIQALAPVHSTSPLKKCESRPEGAFNYFDILLAKRAEKSRAIDWLLFTSGEYDASLAALAAVDHAVGGDPFLQRLNGTVFFEAGREDDAERAFKASIDGEPDSIDAWWGLLAIELKRQQFDSVLAYLKAID